MILKTTRNEYLVTKLCSDTNETSRLKFGPLKGSNILAVRRLALRQVAKSWFWTRGVAFRLTECNSATGLRNVYVTFANIFCFINKFPCTTRKPKCPRVLRRQDRTNKARGRSLTMQRLTCEKHKSKKWTIALTTTLSQRCEKNPQSS
jgi:hypothetical protein